MPVLYRNYRPKNFAEVIGQEHIKTTLQKAVAAGSFAHAYLFTGTRGTGKTSVARILARAINCPEQKNGEPCNNCAICKQFLENNSLDLIEIDAASNTGVENIREIIEHLKFSPTQSKYKVFIIDEVHMLSKGAFNALLKTLEEPPQHAVFILATTEIHKVPATIISRTQRFDFKKIDNQKLLAHLKDISKKEKIKIDDASLELVLNSAEGSVRDALSILDKLSTFDNIDIAQAEKLLGLTNILAAQNFLDLLVVKDSAKALNFLQEQFAGGVDPIQFNKDFLEYLRKVLLVSLGGNINFAFDQNQIKNLNRQVEQIKPNQLLFIIRLFLRANKDFQISPNSELPVEIAAAEACLGQQLNAMPASLQSTASVKTTPVSSLASAAKPQHSTNFVEEESFKPVVQQNLEEESDQDFADLKIVSYQEVLLAWPELMQKVRAVASTLLTVMKSAQVKSVEQNIIVIAFNYKFHKDSLDAYKNKSTFLGVMNGHFNTKFRLTTILEKVEAAENSDTSSIALEVFGEELA
ncbi:MAG: polymerase subunit gamma/tau [Candidatus Doudnabacteria bacterium]|nr:polymerase subunit gamma/tau [Candidatus Doudnabacteria bacterium]